MSKNNSLHIKSKIFQAKAFAKYMLKGGNKHGVHSPFMYDILEQVIYDERHYYIFDESEKYRQQLLKSNQTIEITDFGAGSQMGLGNKRSIKTIAKHALKPKKYAQLLFKFINHFECKNCLEFGTSLGISSLYQAAGLPKNSQLITMEGCPETAKIAQNVINKSDLKDKIKILVGEFNRSIPKVFEQFETLDYVFFDGNHQYQPTLDYFEQCLTKSNHQSIFIFDDIHWSEDMEKAWRVIKKHPSVRVTMDLFAIGVVFFDPKLQREDYIIRY